MVASNGGMPPGRGSGAYQGNNKQELRSCGERKGTSRELSMGESRIDLNGQAGIPAWIDLESILARIHNALC